MSVSSLGVHSKPVLGAEASDVLDLVGQLCPVVVIAGGVCQVDESTTQSTPGGFQVGVERSQLESADPLSGAQYQAPGDRARSELVECLVHLGEGQRPGQRGRQLTCGCQSHRGDELSVGVADAGEDLLLGHDH